MNFKSIIALTVAACTSISSANNLQAPVNPQLGAHTKVHWTVAATDPPAFTLFLMDPTYIWGLYGILGENITDSAGVVNVTIPSTLNTSLNYILKAVDPSNVDRIFFTSPIFKVHA